MNRKVVTSMLCLCVAFLVCLYALKIFFPQEFVMQITNERFVAIGNYVDGHAWLKILCTIATSFITYYFYLCAVCKRKSLDIFQVIIVLGVIVGSILCERVFLNFLTYYSILSMFGLPLLFGAKYKRAYTVFSVHLVSQLLSLNIRGLAENIYTFNFAIGIAMTLECYLWLLLFYILYNFYDEKEKR